MKRILGVMGLLALMAAGCEEKEKATVAPKAERAAVAIEKPVLAAVAPVLPSPTVVEKNVELPQPEAGRLAVTRMVTAKGVEAREPIEAGNVFREKDGPVYAFVELANAGDATVITVEWQPSGGGEARGVVSLDVGASSRWRTWALTRTLYVGAWDCIVRDEEGNELSRTSVVVEPY